MSGPNLDWLLRSATTPHKMISCRLCESEVRRLDEMLKVAGLHRRDFVAAAVRDAIDRLAERVDRIAHPGDYPHPQPVSPETEVK